MVNAPILCTHRDGSLQHVETGLLVHPEGGAGVTNAQLVLHEHGSEPRLWCDTFCAFTCFVFIVCVRFALSDGCIRHVASGLFVHPAGGTGASKVPLLLHPDAPEAAIQGQIFFNFVAIPPNSEYVEKPEAPPPAPEAPSHFLRHVKTGMFVHLRLLANVTLIQFSCTFTRKVAPQPAVSGSCCGLDITTTNVDSCKCICMCCVVCLSCCRC